MKTVLPNHIAIIMDGNRRWAKEHGLPALEGHRRVADKIIEPLVEHAASLEVKYVTFWAWSTENWKRDRQEVEGIMNLLRHFMRKKLERLHKKGVRIRAIGDLGKFPQDIQDSLNNAIEKTANNQRITTVFALNYGGRDELLRAMNRAISYQSSAISLQLSAIRKKLRTKDKNGLPDDWELTAESFSQYLDTAGIPDPEFIIRTGGEQRLSGFLLWQSEYSELYFPSWFMPEFTPEKLDEAIIEYQNRQRRFGK